mmetsp:Transcript_95306/g.308741  ORF Transcript_95306/g.308741 Transcript_95306/m.308741 type:complete len:232 (+) Transcript_95306:1728-2423(+)
MAGTHRSKHEGTPRHHVPLPLLRDEHVHVSLCFFRLILRQAQRTAFLSGAALAAHGPGVAVPHVGEPDVLRTGHARCRGGQTRRPLRSEPRRRAASARRRKWVPRRCTEVARRRRRRRPAAAAGPGGRAKPSLCRRRIGRPLGLRCQLGLLRLLGRVVGVWLSTREPPKDRQSEHPGDALVLEGLDGLLRRGLVDLGHELVHRQPHKGREEVLLAVRRQGRRRDGAENRQH